MVYCTFHGFDKRAELLFFFFLICLNDHDEDDDIEDDNDVCLHHSKRILITSMLRPALEYGNERNDENQFHIVQSWYEVTSQ